MVRKKFLLVLANSQKKGDRCVAGKILTPNENGTCDVGRWVRPVHPGQSEGAIPLEMTMVDHQWLAPLDVIEIGLAKPMGDPDHPEDWQIDPNTPWRKAAVVSKAYMPQLCDDPEDLWGIDSAFSRRVPSGYVPTMTTPSTLRLMTPSAPCVVKGFMEDRKDGRGPRLRVRLEIPHNDTIHTFDVKDLAFIVRYGIKEHVFQYGQFQLRYPEPAKVAFCLSLTPPFNGFQYKIAAAIIELS